MGAAVRWSLAAVDSMAMLRFPRWSMPHVRIFAAGSANVRVAQKIRSIRRFGSE